MAGNFREDLFARINLWTFCLPPLRERDGDIVLLAGKGHEKVQVTQAGAVPFDDVEVARGILASMGYDGEPISSPKAARSSH